MTQTPSLAFSIDRSSATPVFEQICDFIRKKAISGELKTDEKLPPTRAFATELGVSRSTVVSAYEQLVAEGYLRALQGSGYSICAIGEVELPTGEPQHAFPDEEDVPVPRPFLAGQPDMRLFPHKQWAKAVARICRSNPQAMLTGGSSFGNFELRKAIARHAAEWRGIDASPHQIIVTAGSTDGLRLCLKTLIGTHDRVGLENPGYPPLRNLVDALGLQTTFMDIDEEGAKLPRGIARPHLVVLTPSHQYPLGGAMTPARRMDFIRWAEQTDGWIVEDDYDSEFRYAGRPIPAMAGFDRLNRTIYVGSFSKIFSNSLRLGYIIVPESLIDRFRLTMERFGQNASYMPQQALAEFINSGEFYRHLRRARRIYGERRKFFVERLESRFRAFGHYLDHQAGMQIVFHLKHGLNDHFVCEQARAMGLEIQALSDLCETPRTWRNGLVLGYCGYTEAELDEALGKLWHVLHEFSRDTA